MKTLLKSLQAQLSDITFTPGDLFYWSPKTNEVVYSLRSLTEKEGQWALLHEAAHAWLGHKAYHSDFELLLLEVAAWEQAQNIGKQLGYKLDEEHIQNCLDTYRDWLHERSTCPRCGVVSLETTQRQYQCFNCDHEWRVSISRFCRPYRMQAPQNKTSSQLSETMFV